MHISQEKLYQLMEVYTHKIMERRVVVTGMGIHSCLGTSLDEVRDSLYGGKSGIVYEQLRVDQGYQSGLTGNVIDPDLKGVLSRKERKSLGQPARFAYAATMKALESANIDQGYILENEVGVIYGNDSTVEDTVAGLDIHRRVKDTSLIGSAHVFKGMNSTVTMNLASLLKLKGVNLTLSAACASGSHSVGMAYLLIKQGLQDIVISGGAQEVNSMSMATFDALGAFSKRNNSAQQASRPFDSNRDGLVPSGGAASLILEDYEHAVKRGAKIYGEIVSYGFSSNGEGHLSAPNINGPKRAIEKSLKLAGLNISDIDYVNAHATSTPIGDVNEAQAILQTFGKDCPYVSSTKSLTGHECWMAGASEIIYSLVMMNNSFIAPNINLETLDDDIKDLNVVTKTKETKINTLLSNSFGFGGTNASIIMKNV